MHVNIQTFSTVGCDTKNISVPSIVYPQILYIKEFKLRIKCKLASYPTKGGVHLITLSDW